MFIYFGKRFDAADARSTVVGVRCDRCDCEYYYELARIGAGSGSSAYGIGTGAAERSAQAKSERELQRRLATEAELVPCPKCNWINDELVQGYRRGRYRGLAKFAVIVSIIGVVISLLCAWFISIGPPGDRRAVPYFLYGGPALFVAFTVATFGLRTLLRRLIKPNRKFPKAPVLPPGSPPALLIDSSSQELRPAKPIPTLNISPDGWQEFQVGRHFLPLVCCECLKPTTTEHAFSIAVSGQMSLEVPLCPKCANEPLPPGYWGWLFLPAFGFLVGGMAYTLMYYEGEHSCPINAVLLVLFFLAVAGIVKIIMIRSPGPIDSIILDKSRGVVRLRFQNAEYGRRVAAQEHEWDETSDESSNGESSTEFQE